MGGTQTDATLPGAGDEPSDAKRAIAIGARIEDRYRITRFIGEGGMGEVYAAEDQILGTTVALKTLRPELAGSTVAIERFRREIGLARKVSHPNVCRLHDVGVLDGAVFLTMELLEGRTLASELLATGPLPLEELERVAAQLVDGLDALHAVGVVHRDFKTANVMVTGEGAARRVVIMDFGLARSTEANAVLTVETGLLGTPAYMSPEQVEGRAATPASDIYALGIVLYELAVGRVPFSEETALATATARLQRAAPRASATRRDLPRRWDAIIARCLAREPAARFATAREVLVAPRRRRWPWFAVPAIAIVAIAVGFALRGSTHVVEDPARHWPSGLRPASPKAAVHFDQAQVALDEGRWSDARDLLEQATRVTTEDPIAQAALAETLDTLGYEDRAHEAIERAIEHEKTLGDEAKWFVAALRAQIEGDPRAALAPLQRLVEITPRREYRIRLATALVDAGELDSAARTIAGLGPTISAAERISVGLLRAAIARQRGELERMRVLAESTASIARAARRTHDEADALIATASAQWLLHDAAAAQRTYERAISIGDSGSILRARTGLIDLDLDADRIASAAARYRENAALVRSLGNRRLLVELLSKNVWYQADLGHPDAAATDLAEARPIATQLGDESALASIDLGDGFLAQQRGDLVTAARLIEAAYVTSRRLGSDGLSVSAYHNWLPVLEELDDPAALARARAMYSSTVERQVESYLALRDGDLDRAERIARLHADRLTFDGREALVIIAHVAIKRGKLDEATKQLDEVGPLLEGDGQSITARDRLSRARAELLARRGDLPGALAVLDRQAKDCAAGSLVQCEIANAGFAVVLAASIDRAEAARRAPRVLELAREHGYRRTVREIETALR